MANFVGKVGNTLHYADSDYGTFLNYRGLHIEVITYEHSKPLVFVHSLGKVKNDDEAVDKVAEIVRRKRELLALRDNEEDADD